MWLLENRYGNLSFAQWGTEILTLFSRIICLYISDSSFSNEINTSQWVWRLVCFYIEKQAIFYFFILLWKIGLVVMNCCWIPNLFSLFCLLEKNEELLHEDLSFSFSSDDSISEFSLTDVSSDELFSESEVVQLAGKHYFALKYWTMMLLGGEGGRQY